MKVIIIGLPRTRSSYLIDVVAKSLKLKNKFESYVDVMTGSLLAAKSGWNKNYWNNYTDKLTLITNNWFIDDNFVVKLFPNMLMSPDLKYIEKNLEFLRLREYDKIYVLHRQNIYDMIISQLIARQIGRFLYEANKSFSKNVYNTSIDFSTNKVLKEIDYIITGVILHDRIKQYLEERNVNFTLLEYHDIPEYVQENYPNVTSSYQELNINYKDCIKNYDQICDYIDTRINALSEKYSSLKIE